MPRNITLKNLAELLSVSISTVSKALNDSPEISERTKQKVLEAAKRYNYKPNYIAQSLKNNTTKTIGVVIPDILNYFFVKALVGIEQEARKHGYKVVTCISNESLKTEIENVKLLANGSVDGIIISLSQQTQREESFSHINSVAQTIPIVQFDRVSDKIFCDRVISDDFDAAYKAAICLIEQGCKDIVLASTNKDLSVVKLRTKGFLKALKEKNINVENSIFNIDELNDCEEELKKILSKSNIDGICSVDELLSVKIVKTAKRLKIRIPETLRLISFSNGELSKEYSPSISAIDQRADELGEKSVEVLINNIGGEAFSNFTHIISSTIVYRNSTL